eukprot:jgi/Mesvir1/6205/Mv00887-RA.1
MLTCPQKAGKVMEACTRYYCDYCDTYLTHDSASVRKQHNAGYKHKANVRDYYSQFEEEQADKPQAGVGGFNPPPGMPGGFPPGGMPPGMMAQPGMPGIPGGMPRPPMMPPGGCRASVCQRARVSIFCVSACFQHVQVLNYLE